MPKSDINYKSDDAAAAQAKRALNRKNKKIRRLYIGIALLFVLLVGGGVFGYLQYRDLKNENAKLSNPQESAKVESERIKQQVASLIDTPKDEEPTIASVSDAAKAKEQSPAFFANAQNGDRLLIYSKAKKAILYRPSTNKIIEVSALNIEDTAKAAQSQPPAAQQPAANTQQTQNQSNSQGFTPLTP